MTGLDNTAIIWYINYQLLILFVIGTILVKNLDTKLEPGSAQHTTVPETLTKHIGYLISRTAAQFKQQTSALFQPLGIIPPQYLILSTLDSKGRQTQKALGQHLNIDPTTMVWLIDDLEQKKHVRRENNPVDRRAYLVTLTATGKALFERSDKQLSLLEDELLAPLSKGERQTLQRLLTRLYQSFLPEDVSIDKPRRMGKEEMK